MLFQLFSNITMNVRVIGKIQDSNFNVLFFSNPGHKIHKRWTNLSPYFQKESGPCQLIQSATYKSSSRHHIILLIQILCLSVRYAQWPALKFLNVVEIRLLSNTHSSWNFKAFNSFSLSKFMKDSYWCRNSVKRRRHFFLFFQNYCQCIICGIKWRLPM